MRRRPWAAARAEEQDLVLAIDAAVGRTPAERPFFVDVSDPATQSEACRRPAHQVLSAAALLGPCLGLESLCCSFAPPRARCTRGRTAGERKCAARARGLGRRVPRPRRQPAALQQARVPGQRATPCPRGGLCGVVSSAAGYSSSRTEASWGGWAFPATPPATVIVCPGYRAWVPRIRQSDKVFTACFAPRTFRSSCRSTAPSRSPVCWRRSAPRALNIRLGVLIETPTLILMTPLRAWHLARTSLRSTASRTAARSPQVAVPTAAN